MRKALWFLMTRPPSRVLGETGPAAELAAYRRRRSPARRTPERALQEKSYRQRVKAWLLRPENRSCRVYQLLLDRQVPATQCHHYQGRRGMLLLYEPFWIPVSYEGHRWIDEHRAQARALGLIVSAGAVQFTGRGAALKREAAGCKIRGARFA